MGCTLKNNFIFFLVLLFFVSYGFAETIKGKIVGVSDGDTATLLTKDKKQFKIRFYCIDAPEKDQDFGKRSKHSLSDMIFGKEVEVVVHDKDKYGRKVGTVFLDGKDINLEQIKRGMAWVYTYYCKEKKYYDEEEIAKKNRIGLWIQSNPIEPSKFRRGFKVSDVISNTKGKAEKSGIMKIEGKFRCGDKRSCKEMFSCDEAKFYLKNCGLSIIDNDNDGIPCEELCK